MLFVTDVLNPIMFIPFISTLLFSNCVAYFATSLGLVPAKSTMPPWVTPQLSVEYWLTQKYCWRGIRQQLNLAIR